MTGEAQQNCGLGYPPPDAEFADRQREYALKCEAERQEQRSLEREDRLRLAALEAALRSTPTGSGDHQMVMRAARDFLDFLTEMRK